MCFIDLDTQWRHGFSGRTGLDYGAVFQVFRHLGLKRKKQRQWFSDIRVMEAAALDEIHRKEES
jgi:hypothetical protein